MKNIALLEETAKLTGVLEEHINRLKGDQGQLHEIDIELMSAKVREIYELVHKLKPETSDGSAKETEEIKAEEEVKQTETPPAMDVQEDIQPAETETAAGEEHENAIIPEHETVAAAEAEVKVMEEELPETKTETVSAQENLKEPEEEKETEEKETPLPEAKTTADLFSGTATIADSFQDGEDRSIAANMNLQPVEDLKMAIGINDKFLFINELFGGNPSDYNEAIEKLNHAESSQEAENTLADYGLKHNWDEHADARNRLKQLIEKKFN